MTYLITSFHCNNHFIHQKWCTKSIDCTILKVFPNWKGHYFDSLTNLIPWKSYTLKSFVLKGSVLNSLASQISVPKSSDKKGLVLNCLALNRSDLSNQRQC